MIDEEHHARCARLTIPKGALRLYISNACNYKCPYCVANITANEYANQHEDPLTKKWVANIIKALKIKTMTFCGLGEPTLYPNFRDVIEACENLDDALILTNATSSIEKLSGLGSNFRFILSLHPTGNNEELVAEKYRILSKDHEVSVHTVINGQNFSVIRDMMEKYSNEMNMVTTIDVFDNILQHDRFALEKRFPKVKFQWISYFNDNVCLLDINEYTIHHSPQPIMRLNGETIDIASMKELV